MKIWLLDPRNYTPYYNYSLAKALGDASHEVQLYTAPFPYDDDLNGLNDVPIAYMFNSFTHVPAWIHNSAARPILKMAPYPVDAFRFSRNARKHHPDVLHIQWAPVPVLDIVHLRYLKRLGNRLVYTVHNVLPHERRPWHRPLYRQLYQTVHRLIVHSEAAKSALVTQFDLPVTKIHVIPQGNLADFAQPVVQSEARERLGLGPAASVVLFFGIIREYKGLDDLIRAFASVRDQLPDTHLLIVGRPHYLTDMQPYHTLLQELCLTEVTHLHLEYVPHTELGLYFGAADLVVLPYKDTDDSAVLPTAYTFGRPVITTETGGLPEAVDIGQSGLIVPPGDVTELASAMADLLSDRKRLEQMGIYAYHLAQTHHSWTRIAAMTADVYAEVCQSAGP